MVQICHHRHGLRTAAATAAGAAGALFFPLLSATDAQAVAHPVWDALAACESGGNWHAHTGNGFQGGLQFSASTWVAHGGTAYAPRADEASRGEQINIAERVLADQGPTAWPVCSRRIGLYAAVTSNAGEAVGEARALRHSVIRWTTLIRGYPTRHHCRRTAHRNHWHRQYHWHHQHCPHHPHSPHLQNAHPQNPHPQNPHP
ncbi:MAG: transglycosylase family protein, partial [Streptomycetaceae bacterium]|nr:transglycosylase family protein [Streptomycetaceae bacterium]